MPLRVLSRPWSLLAGRAADIREAAPGATITIGPDHCALLASEVRPEIDGDSEGVEPHATVSCPGQAPIRLFRIPLPVHPSHGHTLRQGSDDPVHIAWREVPDRPLDEIDKESPEQKRGEEIMSTVLRVTAKLRFIEREIEAPVEPEALWERTLEHWWDHDGDADDPTMEVIVRHAEQLDRLLLEVSQHPRRVLVRSHRMTPVSRVQEVDRRSMLWFARQPGHTLEERAGPSQRLLAPVRLQTVDTPENRVFRALAHHSRNAARSYRRLNPMARGNPRYREVERYERRCTRIARTLADAGVPEAAPGLPPNHVLQHDARYRRIWRAYQEILRRRRVQDEMWRWQARSWEEFCLVTLMLGCMTVPGAELIAGSPIRVHPEHVHGTWLVHDDPFAVFHLSRQRLILEITRDDRALGPREAALGASAWLRIGDFSGRSCRRVAVWALQSFKPGPLEAELDSMDEAIARVSSDRMIGGGVVLRLLTDPDKPCGRTMRVFGGRRSLALDLGPAARQFTEGLSHLGEYFQEYLRAFAQGSNP